MSAAALVHPVGIPPLGSRAFASLPRACKHRLVTLLVDLFAGGGGTSTGALRVLSQILGLTVGKDARVIAINHDAKALATHKRNHPEAEHWEDDVEKLDPRDVLQCPDCGEILQITELVGSPPCPDFSNAAGGKPKNRQRRATVYYILKWIRWGRPKRGTFENVPEFLKTPEYRKFKRGIQTLRKIGLRYRVEEKVLNAADYGGAQSRKRAFIKIALDDEPIAWPVQTHSKGGKVPGTKPWVGAVTVLNLNEPTRSVFGRKKPLSPKTRARIARGIRARGRFWEPLAASVVADAGPVPLRALVEACPSDEWPSALKLSFTLGQQGGAEARPTTEQVATIASAGYVRLAEAFLLPVDGIRGNGTTNPPRELTEPLATIRAERGGGHIIEPRLVQQQGTEEDEHELNCWCVRCFDKPPAAARSAPQADALIFHVTHPDDRPTRSAADPLPTITAANRGELALADARLIVTIDRPETNRSLAKDTGEPLPTVVANNERVAVVEPFLLSNVGRAAEHEPRPASEPLGTILTRDGTHVVAPFFIAHHGERSGQLPRFHEASEPMPTVPASRAHDVVLLRLVQTYNGNGGVRDATEPLSTETAVERHALVEVRVDALLVDVGMRMLTVRELARGQGFPDSYEFLGNKGDQVRQVGNAVHVDIAYHLIAADFSGLGYRDTRLSDFGGAAA